MLEGFTLETFSRLVGDRFTLLVDAAGAEPLTVRLAEAEAGGQPPGPQAARPPFSLVFRSPAAPILAQRIYRLEHPTLGTFDLFLVPLQPDADGARYEAVFA
jgi:hypothetical protein